MIIPFIFTLDPVYENLSQTWVFWKAVAFCKKRHWPVIAQKQYFEEWDRQNKLFPQFFQKDVCRMFEFDVPKKSDILYVENIVIPVDIENGLIEMQGTQSDAFMFSFREAWPEMEDYLCSVLEEIIKRKDEKIEAITTLTYLQFLDNVSKRTGIPIIYYEWGPFRYSTYRNTAFFDIDREYRNVQELYNSFESNKVKELPILNNAEILALFLKQEYLHYLENDKGIEEKYELGIVSGYNSLVETSAYTRISMIEMYSRASQIFDEKDIAVRYHPGDPLHSKMNVVNEESGSLIDFLLLCKRVMCISSNVEIEAMLFDKPVYDEGYFKLKGIVNSNILNLNDKLVSKEVINFIVFVILCPFELLNSVEYIRFRLKCNDLHEIYMYHLRYYLNSLGLTDEVLKLSSQERMDIILKAREYSIDKISKICEKMQFNNDEVECYTKIQQQKDAYDFLKKEYQKIVKEKEDIEKEYVQKNSDLINELNNIKRENEIDKMKIKYLEDKMNMLKHGRILEFIFSKK